MIVVEEEARALLVVLQDRGVRLTALSDGRLEVRPLSLTSSAEQAQIISHRDALVALLQAPEEPEVPQEEPEPAAAPPGTILVDGRLVAACQGVAERWAAQRVYLEEPKRGPRPGFRIGPSWGDVSYVKGSAIPVAPPEVPLVVQDCPVPLLRTADELTAALADYTGPVALDLETNKIPKGFKYGVRPFGYKEGRDQVAVLSVCLYTESGPVLGIVHLPDGAIPPELQAALGQPGRVLITHNGTTFDHLFLSAAGVDVFAAQHYDTMLSAEVLLAGQDKWSKEKGEKPPVVHVSYREEVQRRVGLLLPKELQKIDWRALLLLTGEHLHYCACDVLPLLPLALAQLEAASAEERYAIALEQQLTAVTLRTTINGMPILQGRLAQQIAAYEAQIAEPQAQFEQLFPGINPRSPGKLRVAMEERYSCPISSLNKDSMSAAIAGHQPWEEGAKLRQAYTRLDMRLRMLRDYRDQFCAPDGCMHGTYNQYGARSGRYSSRKPNEQQVARDVRAVFGPEPLSKNGKNGKNSEGEDPECLIIIDLSQIELCLNAIVTGDELLQAAVKTGKAYQVIAADILKRAMESITEKERQDYKAYTLAMGYGGSADVLVKAMAKQGIDMPREEAEKIVQSYLRTYKGVAEARRKAKLHCKRSLPLRVKLATGLSRLYRSDQVDGGRAANSLLATRVSGLAAAGLKVGILLAHDQGLDRYLVNLVHDEVVLRCQLSQARALRDAMSACIIEGTKRVCPGAHVAVERHIGPSWDKKERFPAEVFTYEETDQ